MTIQTPGILLQSVTYLGQKKILKVFTPKHGLITLMANRVKTSALTTPFCLAEWVYEIGKSEVHPLKDATLLDSYLELKKDYDTLQAAGSIAIDLIRTQFPNKDATLLFDLTKLYLKHLPKNPTTFQASFKLKLLQFEGLLMEEKAPFFEDREWQIIQTLTSSRSLKEIQETLYVPNEKIKTLFESQMT
jgi:DNA repair protein RecO